MYIVLAQFVNNTLTVVSLQGGPFIWIHGNNMEMVGDIIKVLFVAH